MHMRTSVRRLASAAFTVGLVGLMVSVAQTAAAPPAIDIPAQVQSAVNRGDIATLNQLIPSPAPGPAASVPGRPLDAAQSTALGIHAPLSAHNTYYEELKACGFYAEETRLECTIEIKQKTGYNGFIGQFGAMEHVYFCVLVLNSSYFGWYPLGIGSVQVHDESAGASPPWQYAVYRDFNPPGQVRVVDDPTHHTVTTQTMGQTYYVKATLSYWLPVDNCNSPPPTWGNTVYFFVRADPIR